MSQQYGETMTVKGLCPASKNLQNRATAYAQLTRGQSKEAQYNISNRTGPKLTRSQGTEAQSKKPKRRREARRKPVPSLPEAQGQHIETAA